MHITVSQRPLKLIWFADLVYWNRYQMDVQTSIKLDYFTSKNSLIKLPSACNKQLFILR